MKQKRFNVEQILVLLKQAEAGVPLTEMNQRVEVSEQTFYRSKKQHVGLEMDQVRQLKQLQGENTGLKQLIADLTLDKAMPQDMAADHPRAALLRNVPPDWRHQPREQRIAVNQLHIAAITNHFRTAKEGKGARGAPAARRALGELHHSGYARRADRGPGAKARRRHGAA